MKFSITSAIALAAALSFPVQTMAQAYPTKPIRMVVPFPPGGSPDIVGRLIATKLAERLGNQVVIDNRGGAGGIIGTEIVARAAPDGYTFLFTSTPHAVLPNFHKLPFDPVKSFLPVSRIGTAPNALVINQGIAAKSVKEFIALAQQKPGQFNFGAAGVGTSTHLAAELFKMMTNIDVIIVQYRGGGPSLIAVIGGQSQALFGTLVQNMPQVRAGNIRLLAVGSPKRNAQLPDVPTVAETLPGFESMQWWGMFAPAGTPPPIVERLSKEIRAVLAPDDIKKRFTNDGAEVDHLAPAEFAWFLQKEIGTWSGVVKKAGIKLD